MKIAYLMNGVIGGLSGKNYEYNDLDIRSEIIKYTSYTHNHLLNNDVEIDYFIFSWEPNLEKYYIELYQPKNIISKNQIKFNMPDHYKDYTENSRIQAHYSRWYGAQQVLNMFLDYKNTNNISYDLVINARLDLCFHHNINFLNFENTKFHIAKPINLPNYNWPNNNEMIDHIFASSETNMIQFLNLFDYLNEYTKPGECPRWKLISNHFLTVWHLKKINLLRQDIINQSFSLIDEGFNLNTDYHIFRYENLTANQLIQRNNELYRNTPMGQI